MVPNARHNAPQEQSSFALDTELQYQCCKIRPTFFLPFSSILMLMSPFLTPP